MISERGRGLRRTILAKQGALPMKRTTKMRHAQFRSKTACLKNAFAAGASLAALGSAGAALAQVQQPSAPLQLRTDYLGYSASASARRKLSAR